MRLASATSPSILVVVSRMASCEPVPLFCATGLFILVRLFLDFFPSSKRVISRRVRNFISCFCQAFFVESLVFIAVWDGFLIREKVQTLQGAVNHPSRRFVALAKDCMSLSLPGQCPPGVNVDIRTSVSYRHAGYPYTAIFRALLIETRPDVTIPPEPSRRSGHRA